MENSDLLFVEESSNIVIINDSSEFISVEGSSEIVVVSEAIQGQQGLQGPPGGGFVSYPFSWGDATPAIILTTGINKTVYCVQLIVLTAFNGTGTTLSIGDSLDHERLLSTSQNDPTTVATYESFPTYKYTLATPINLYITLGSGASSGTGLLILYTEN